MTTVDAGISTIGRPDAPSCSRRQPDFLPAESPVRWVVIAEGQRLFADLLDLALRGDPELAGRGRVRAADVPDGVLGVDLVVLASSGVDADAIRLIGRLRERCAPAAIVVLGTRQDELGRRRAIHAGADDWVASTARVAEIRTVLRRAGRRAQAPPAVVPVAAVVGVVGPMAVPVATVALTSREQDVLDHLAHGHPATVTARVLGISAETCRGHLKNLLRKLGAHSQLEALAIARRQGLVST